MLIEDDEIYIPLTKNQIAKVKVHSPLKIMEPDEGFFRKKRLVGARLIDGPNSKLTEAEAMFVSDSFSASQTSFSGVKEEPEASRPLVPMPTLNFELKDQMKVTDKILAASSPQTEQSATSEDDEDWPMTLEETAYMFMSRPKDSQ